jgi:H/ACA ribonucleoprotein complex subunit 3
LFGIGGQILELDGERPITRLGTAAFGGTTAFDASDEGLYRIEDDRLIEARSGRRLGSVLEGQTWIAAGERLGYGFYRAGKLTVHFAFGPDRPLAMLDLPPLAGRLLEIDAVFDAEHTLVSTLTELGPRRTAAVWLLDGRGTLIASAAGEPDSSPILGATAGKALMNGRIVVATDQGLLAVAIDGPNRRLVPSHRFTDTAPFVFEGDRLLPGPGGSVYAVQPQQIVQLCWEP